ncbi:MAG: hypothetical protein Q9213_001195 [Squamulea squamosa]
MAQASKSMLPAGRLLQLINNCIASVDMFFEGVGQPCHDLCNLRNQLLALKGVLQLLRVFRNCSKEAPQSLLVSFDLLRVLSDHLRIIQHRLADHSFPTRLRPIPPWPISANESIEIVSRLEDSRQNLETLLTPSLYEKLFARVFDFERHLLRKAFVWLACAVCPLTVAELAEAIIIRDGVYQLGCNDRLPKATDVLRIGGSLLLCDPRTNHVTFAHTSLREYLLSEAIKSGPAAMFALSQNDCHQEILISCLTYLQLDVFGNGPCLDEHLTPLRFKPYPLLQYCVIHWTKHATTPALDELVPQYAPRLLRIADMNFLTSYLQCRGKLETRCNSTSTQINISSYLNPISWAAVEGLCSSVKALLDMRAQADTPEGPELQLKDSLIAAVTSNQYETVRILIEAGADIVACNTNYGNAVQNAAAAGFVKILRLLLDQADDLHLEIDCPEYHNHVPASSTMMRLCLGTGNLECAKMLLFRSASGDLYHRELWAAIKNRHYELAHLLLEHGTILRLEPDKDKTPLQLLFMGKDAKAIELIEYCLQRKLFSVDHRDTFGQTPLHYAARNDNVKATQLLLEAGADCMARTLPQCTTEGVEGSQHQLPHSELDDGNCNKSLGDTPLHSAASFGGLSTIELLIKHGADLHALGEDGRTVIQLALFNNSEEVVTWALSNGANVNCRQTFIDLSDKKGKAVLNHTPIMRAAKNGRWNIVRLLLASGTGPDIPCDLPNAVHYAAASAPVDLVELLAHTATHQGDSTNAIVGLTMRRLAIRGLDAVLRIFIHRGADVEQKPVNRETFLHIAALYGHLGVIEALLDAGADINAISIQEKETALIGAARWPRLGHTNYFYQQFSHIEDEVRMYGNPYIEPDLGTHKTAMHYMMNHISRIGDHQKPDIDDHQIIGIILTARHERISVIRALVKAGADINATNRTGETALHAAAVNGNTTIVKVLLASGADIYAQNRSGLTPLDFVQSPRSQQRPATRPNVTELDLEPPFLTTSFSPPSLSPPPNDSEASATAGTAGSNQNTGYLLCILLKNKAVTSTTALLSKITGNRYQPNSLTFISTAASNAVAPAGGWVVFVACMITIATAVEREPTSHSNDWNFSGGSRLNNFTVQTAETAEMKWPTISARGWARGLSMAQ